MYIIFIIIKCENIKIKVLAETWIICYYSKSSEICLEETAAKFSYKKFTISSFWYFPVLNSNGLIFCVSGLNESVLILRKKVLVKSELAYSKIKITTSDIIQELTFPKHRFLNALQSVSFQESQLNVFLQNAPCVHLIFRWL